MRRDEYLLTYNGGDGFDAVQSVCHRATGIVIEMRGRDVAEVLAVLEKRAATMRRCFGRHLRPRNKWGE